MSIKTNTTSLQDLLERVNALPDAGGVDLPELTNEGTAVDLAIGKQLIDSEGNVVTGTILHQNRTFAVAPVQDDDTYISSKYAANYEKRIIGDGAYLKIRNRLSHFGDVSADEVMSGKTFTSTEGLKKTGTFSIDNELNTQDGLISQLQAVVDSLFEATPEISVSSNGLITATAGTKTSTHQLAFQPAKTITPSTASQIAVSSGYYTGGNITIAAIPDTYVKPSYTKTTATYTPTTTNQTISAGTYLTGVQTIKGDANLIAGNIKSGVSIFGVAGTLVEDSGSGGTSIEDGLITRSLSTYANNRVSSIREGAFMYMSNLQSVNLPNVKIIGSNAFRSCSKLTTISLPACTSIGDYAFYMCSTLTTADFPVCTTVGYGVFDNAAVRYVNLPACTTIGAQAFGSCLGLTTISLPACTSIGDYAFYMCSTLTTADFPVCATIGNVAFSTCYGLTTISFPACTTIGYSAFQQCSKITTANFPACRTIDKGAFSSCRNLTTASFPVCTTIGSSAFYKCVRLQSLYLTGSSLCKLSATGAFVSTPIAGYSASAGTYGSIYVPASLLASYKAATNWTYYSSRFVAYDE